MSLMKIISVLIFYYLLQLPLSSSFFIPLILKSSSNSLLQQSWKHKLGNTCHDDNNHLILCRQQKTKLKLRNFDLPEALIFYGLDTIIDTAIISSSGETNEHGGNGPKVRPGVLRLMKESKEINTPIIVLSEHFTMDEISARLNSADEIFTEMNIEDKILHYRSSLEEYVVNYDQIFQDNKYSEDSSEEYEYPPTFQGKGFGHAPSPAALMDAVNSIRIQPRGFGGSSGFGVKYADAIRNPLPQHCVVFVSGTSDKQLFDNKYEGSISRDRCIASRTAGMRVMYIEDNCLGSCTAEDVSDGIVESLGTEQDWSMVTMDDISTPGSFWLNMAQPRDENGDRVNVYDVVEYYENLRTQAKQDFDDDDDDDDNKDTEMSSMKSGNESSDALDEDELLRILADLDSL